MDRPRVFFPITSQRFNFAPARVFGDVVFLLKTETFSPFQTEMIYRIFRSELRQTAFDPARDFIGLTGPTNFVALLASFMASEYGPTRTLFFDARVNEYVERTVPGQMRRGGGVA